MLRFFENRSHVSYTLLSSKNQTHREFIGRCSIFLVFPFLKSYQLSILHTDLLQVPAIMK